MRIIAKTFTVLISLILITAAAGVALLAFPIFGNQALIVRSGSMEPNIPVGSVIVVRNSENTSGNLYDIGEVISYKHDANTIITHRIIEIEKNPRGGYGYITKGDANEEADGWVVKEENILGKNYFTIPEFGRLLAFARSQYGFPLLIILPAVFVILMEFVNIIGEIVKYNKKKKGGILGDTLGPKFSEQMPEPEISPDSYFTKRNFFALKIILPLIIFSAFFQSTSAFFSDTKTSPDNLFQAASAFPTTPTPTDGPDNVPEECSHIKFFGEPIIGTELDDEIEGTPDNNLIIVFGGNNTVKGGAGNDCIVATGGFNLIDGDSGNDVIITGDSDDEVFGGSGDDIVFSSGGDDFLHGGSGDDTLIGGTGEDSIDGGTGKDTCEGEELRRCEE